MSLNSAPEMSGRHPRFERAALTTWTVTMVAYLVWLLAYAAVEFRPSS